MQKELKYSFVIQWAILGVTLLSLLGAISYNLQNQYTYVRDEERRRLLTQTRVIYKNISYQLTGVEKVLLSIRDELAGQPCETWDVTALTRRMETITNAIPGARTLIVTDAWGIARISNRKEVVGQDVSRRPHFDGARRDADVNRLFLSPPFQTTLNTWIIALTRVIPGKNGEFAGIVTISLNPEYFKTILSSVNYAPDMWTAIAHGDGALFVMTPEREGQPRERLLPPGTPFSSRMESNLDESVLIDKSKATGEERMMAVSVFRPGNLPLDKPLVIGVARSLAAIMRDWRNEALKQGGALAFLVLCCVSALAVFQRRQRFYSLELEKADIALRESESRFRKLFEDSADAASILENGLFIDCNQAALDMFGMSSPEQLLSRSPDQLSPEIQPDGRTSREKAAAMLSEAKEKGKHQFEWVHARANGEPFFTEILLTPIRHGERQLLHTVWRDLTERKAAEQAVAELLDFNRKIVEHSPHGIIVYKASGPAVMANQAAARTIGATVQQLERQNFHDIASWKEVGLYDCALETLQTGMFHGKEAKLETSFGREIWVRCDFIPFTGKEEQHLLMIQTDVSSYRHVELMLEKARIAAEEANQAKSRFLANMGHEIRTPMNAIIGLGQLALKTDLTSKQHDYLEKIVLSANSLMDILNDILDISKIEAGMLTLESTTFFLHECLSRTVKLMAAGAEQKGLEVLSRVDHDVPDLLIGDPLRLGQVLGNLLSNAIKFTEHGRVTLSVSRGEEADSPENVRLRFSVQDSGIGIEKEKLGMLFDVFSQADGSTTRRYGGTGVGLSISKKLVQMMRGTIEVESEPGTGSTFTVTALFGLASKPFAQTLPMVTAAPPETSCTSGDTPERATGTSHGVSVEELKSVLDQLSEYLEKNDLRACRLVNRLTSLLPPQPDLQKLERHIDDLSFLEAREALARLARGLT